MEGFILFGILLLFLFLRVPIAFASGLVALIYMLWSGLLPVEYAPLAAFQGLDSFTVLAVPLLHLCRAGHGSRWYCQVSPWAG